MRMRTILTAAAIALVVSGTLQAQQATGGVDVRIAPGFVRQGGIFGDDDPKSSSRFGVSIGAQVRGQSSRRTGLSLEAVFQPTGLRNPHFDETLRTLYLLVGPEIGRRTYVRPAGGVALQIWSGTMTESGMNLALAFGVAVGHRLHVGSRYQLGPELIARGSFSPGAGSWMMGVQVPVSWTTR